MIIYNVAVNNCGGIMRISITFTIRGKKNRTPLNSGRFVHNISRTQKLGLIKKSLLLLNNYNSNCLNHIRSKKMNMDLQLKHPFDSTHNVELLTRREKEILHYITKGLQNKAISKLLNISTKTVSFHKENIKTKLGSSLFECYLAQIASSAKTTNFRY